MYASVYRVGPRGGPLSKDAHFPPLMMMMMMMMMMMDMMMMMMMMMMIGMILCYQ
jgi:hypothetical protein